MDALDWNALSSLETTDANTFPIEEPFVPSSGNLHNLSVTTFGNEIIHDQRLSQYVDQEKFLNSDSSSASPENRDSWSSGTSSSTSRLSKHKTKTLPVDSSRVEKRKQNTLAARRYRQKRVDQMSTLEGELKETQSERDALKVRVARLEGEVETLRQLLRP